MRMRLIGLLTLLLPEVCFGSVNGTLNMVAGEHVISRPNGPASLSGITWVSNSTYLAATDWNPTLWELTLPLDETTGFAMYEGICEGPRLKDGARSLVLVSDGDQHTAESILTLKLEKKSKKAN